MVQEVLILLIFKAIVYRLIRILILLLVSYLVLGNLTAALSISFIDAIVATVYYYYFDKLWAKFEIKAEHWKLEYKYRKMK